MALLFVQVAATKKNTFYLPVSADNATVKELGLDCCQTTKHNVNAPQTLAAAMTIHARHMIEHRRQ